MKREGEVLRVQKDSPLQCSLSALQIPGPKASILCVAFKLKVFLFRDPAASERRGSKCGES